MTHVKIIFNWTIIVCIVVAALTGFQAFQKSNDLTPKASNQSIENSLPTGSGPIHMADQPTQPGKITCS